MIIETPVENVSNVDLMQEFEMSMRDPVFLETAKNESIRMYNLIEREFTERYSPIPTKLLERMHKFKEENPDSQFEIPTRETPGIKRLSRLDFGVIFQFESREELDKINIDGINENFKKFCFDYFCVLKAFDFINKKSNNGFSKNIDHIQRNLIIGRNRNEYLSLSFKHPHTGLEVFVVALDNPSSNVVDISFRITTTAHEIAHNIVPQFLATRMTSLDAVQKPPLKIVSANQDWVSKYPPNLVSVANVVSELIPMIIEVDIANAFTNSEQILNTLKDLRTDPTRLHGIAFEMANHLRSRGLTTELLPIFIAKLMEEFDGVNIKNAYRDYGSGEDFKRLMDSIVNLMPVHALD